MSTSSNLSSEYALATPVWLRRLTKLTAASTLFLIFAGAMVTSTASGLAVPDWPLSYGMLFPPMVGGIFYEHGHRMVATTVGFLVLVQAFWLQRSEPKSVVRALGWIALLAVIIQGLLGGLTVLFLLPTAVSVSHASLAEIFFCLTVTIAFMTSKFAGRLTGGGTRGTGLARLSRILTAAVFVQIVIGALMRHLGAGLAIPDWPLSFGKIVPPLVSLEIATNFAHRMWGLVVAAMILAFAPAVFRRVAGSVRTVYGVLVAAVVLQVALGGATVLLEKAPLLTSLHVVTGAFVLANTLVFALSAHRIESREPEPADAGQEVVA
jgi:cytochrome c oxidase assembly protein subunit 15